MPTTSRWIWLWAAAAAGLVLAVLFPLHTLQAHGAVGFPLDDAWIHLTYARTLREHGSFAYFPGGPLTNGSTAPLFTLLEAAGFLFTTHEKLLGIILGLLAQAAFLVVFARWVMRRLGDARWAALAVALVGLDGRIALLAVSGMETSLFMALTALAIDRWLARRSIACGLTLGAALWVRPDALILVAVLGIDGLWPAGAPSRRKEAARGARHRPVAAREHPAAPAWPRADLVRASAAFGAVALAYFAFNVATGGRPLPSTFAAKTAFYATNSRMAFVTGDVAQCFTWGAWAVLAPFALLAIVREAVALARGRTPSLRPEAGWALALPLAYFFLLPYSHRFTRYLVPALPAYAILGVAGLRAALRAGWVARALRGPARGVALALLLAGLAVLHGRLVLDAERFYQYLTGYHAERHEQAGHWLAEHTPTEAVVATHDVGAIAFYSRRRLVDAVGLVTPEVAPWLHQPTYTDSLTRLFDRAGVTQVAAYDDWLAVDNVSPLATFGRDNEILRVFPWIPGRTHLLSGEVANLSRAAGSQMAGGDFNGALATLRAAIARDPRSSRLWTMTGDALARTGQLAPARDAWERARALDPDEPAIANRLAMTADSTQATGR